MTTVAIIQPSYLPWKGFFHIMQGADVFIFLDDVQFTTRDWRNRNRVKDPCGGSLWLTVPVKGVRFATWTVARVAIGLLRSIHELLWAVIFLAAMGLSDLAAVVAITLPYAGTLAKIFSEMVDEAPRDVATAYRNAGAGAVQTFSFGLLPLAAPDMGAYTLYRFECALRSSAILGFFGPETLGKFIKQAWNENHYSEVWTYLYALFALVRIRFEMR